MSGFQPVAPEPERPELVSQEDIRSGVDEIARDILDETMRRELVMNLYEMTKRTKRYVDRNPCSKCGCKHFRTIQVDNVEGSLKAMELLMNRLGGRPGTAAGDDSGVVVKRIVVGVDH